MTVLSELLGRNRNNRKSVGRPVINFLLEMTVAIILEMIIVMETVVQIVNMTDLMDKIDVMMTLVIAIIL